MKIRIALSIFSVVFFMLTCAVIHTVNSMKSFAELLDSSDDSIAPIYLAKERLIKEEAMLRKSMANIQTNDRDIASEETNDEYGVLEIMDILMDATDPYEIQNLFDDFRDSSLYAKHVGEFISKNQDLGNIDRDIFEEILNTVIEDITTGKIDYEPSLFHTLIRIKIEHYSFSHRDALDLVESLIDANDLDEREINRYSDLFERNFGEL